MIHKTFNKISLMKSEQNFKKTNNKNPLEKKKRNFKKYVTNNKIRLFVLFLELVLCTILHTTIELNYFNEVKKKKQNKIEQNKGRWRNRIKTLFLIYMIYISL